MTTSLQKYGKRHPTRVLAAALCTKVERRYFEEKTSRADVAAMFHVTMNQLTKAVTGIDYESGPHAYERKRTIDVDSTTPAKVLKAATTMTPSTSRTKSQATSSTETVQKTQKDKDQESDDMLSSSPNSSDSDSLPEVNLTSTK